jgi:hypothetical protein
VVLVTGEFVGRSETSLRVMIAGLAAELDWRWMHVRPARSSRPGVWLTAVDGPLGVGWPDLFLVRGDRSLAIEVKTDRGELSPEQRDVLARLSMAGVETFVATPETMRALEAVLR